MYLDDLARISLGRKWLILGIASASAALMFAFGSLTLLKYEAETSVLIRPLGADSLTGLSKAIQPKIGVVDAPNLSVLNNYGETFTHILSSRPLVSEVVSRMNAEQSIDHAESFIDSVIEVLKYPIRIILYGSQPAFDMDSEEKAIRSLQQGIDAEIIYRTSVMVVRYKDKDAQRATDTLNTLIDMFIEHTDKLNKENTRVSAEFIEKEKEKVRLDLSRLKAEEYSLKREAGVYTFADIDEILKKQSKKLETLEEDYEQSIVQSETLKDRLKRIEMDIEQYPEYVLDSYTAGASARLLPLKKRILDLKIELQDSQFEYPTGSSFIKRLQNKLAMTEATLAEELKQQEKSEINKNNPLYQKLVSEKLSSETELATIPFYQSQVQSRIDDTKEKLLHLTNFSTRIQDISFKQSSLKQQNDLLQGVYDYIKVLSARGLGEVQVLSRAVVPRYPSIRGAPLVVFVTLAFAAGMFLGTALVVLRYHAAQRKAPSPAPAERDNVHREPVPRWQAGEVVNVSERQGHD